MRAAIYARVSSLVQRDRHTIASQLSTLPAFIAQRGWELVGTYVDDGHTAKAGHLGEREAFTRLLKDARAHAFEVVAVVDLDRLTRSEDLRERGEVLGTFQAAGVQLAVASTGQVLDLRSSMGDLMSSLGAFFAAEENRKRRDRTVRGRQEAARQGRPSSRPPWGFAFDRAAGAWKVDEKVAGHIRAMFERVAAGESTGAIAVDMDRRKVANPRGGEWARHRVYCILTQPAYRGEWLADKKRRIMIAVPPIVPEELWHQVQEALQAGKLRGLRRTKHVYLLEALAVCGACGSPIVIHDPRSNGKTTPYYVCRRRRHRQAFGESCGLPLRQVGAVDQRVWAAVTKLLGRPDHLERALALRTRQAGRDETDWAKDLAGFEQQLERLERAQKAILERFARGLIPEAVLDAELQRAGRERRLLVRQVETARRQAGGARKDQVDSAALREQLAPMRARLAGAGPELQQAFVRALVPSRGACRVVLGAESIELHVLVGAGGVGLAELPGCPTLHDTNAVAIRLVA